MHWNHNSIVLVQSQSKANFRMFLTNFMAIFLFFCFSCLLSSIIFIISFLLSLSAENVDKLTAYECGFNPFDDSRNEFDIRFYIIAILFLIFDLEISYLFPFSVSFDIIGINGFFSMLAFLIILTAGFIYEWKKGALDWD